MEEWSWCRYFLNLEKHLFAYSEISSVGLNFGNGKRCVCFSSGFLFSRESCGCKRKRYDAVLLTQKFVDGKSFLVFCFASFVVGVWYYRKGDQDFSQTNKTLGDWDQHLPNTELSLILTVCIKDCAVSSCPKASLPICLRCICFFFFF